MTMVKAHVFTHELVAGRYQLVDVVHRETNRISWYGKDIDLQRPYLLTQIVLPPGTDGDTAALAASRVLRMSETMGLLCPSGVATVVDAVEDNGVLWTVSEWIDGTPLGELLGRERTFEPERAARVGLELLDVLETAHGQGITHAELSPGQVFVRDDGSVVVTGFGLAGATLAPRLTAPSYASPEQARDERIGPAADLWALGAILYTMLEGRPPFRDRGRPEVTLKGVDRLPVRTPVRAGPLARTVHGLLRKDSRERLTRQVVREALAGVLDQDPAHAGRETSRARWRGVYAAAWQSAPAWRRRTMTAGTALAVVTVVVAVLAATRQLPGTDGNDTATAPRPSPSSNAPRPTDRTEGHSTTVSPSASLPASRSASTSASASASAPATPTVSPSPSGTALPSGFRHYTAPEGFSIALPEGFSRIDTSRQSDVAYRVTFGAENDPRTLAVTYSTVVGSDPVAVWRDDVEPELRAYPGYQRVGAIGATTYQGRQAADMEWLLDDDGTRVHTFGRGFLLGGGTGFSLRWTTPEADWDDAVNRQALKTFLRTFRVPSG
ncbi:serine/threonine protein kinase [Streptomyces sp. 7R007]